MRNRRAEGWSRREFLGGLALGGTAGFLGLQPGLVAAEPPPETTRLRLYGSSVCFAPHYVAKRSSRAKGSPMCNMPSFQNGLT